MRTKGQIQFGEMIMVVIVIVLLLVIGMVFFFNSGERSIRADMRHYEDISSLKLAKSVLSLPEVQCEAYQGSGCVDLLKVEALASKIYKRCGKKSAVTSYYCQLFGYATINITAIDPSFKRESQIGFYESIPGMAVHSAPQYLYATLYDPLKKTKVFAYFTVTRYSREVSQ